MFGIHIQCKDLLLSAFCPALGVSALLGLVQLAAPRIKHRLAVGRESEAGDRLAIVCAVVSHRPRGANEVRAVRQPHVADSFRIEDPRDATAVCGSYQLAGET